MGWRQSHAHLSMNGDWGTAWPSGLASEISTATAAGGNPCEPASILVPRLLTATVILWQNIYIYDQECQSKHFLSLSLKFV